MHSLGRQTGQVYLKIQKRFLKRLQTLNKTPTQALGSFLKMNVAALVRERTRFGAQVSNLLITFEGGCGFRSTISHTTIATFLSKKELYRKHIAFTGRGRKNTVALNRSPCIQS